MKNARKKEQITRFSSLVVGASLLLGGTLSTIAQVSAADDINSITVTKRNLSADEKTYRINPFSEKYSRGVIFRDQSATIDADVDHTIELEISRAALEHEKIVLDDSCLGYAGFPCYLGSNTAKDTEVYVDTIRGAILDNRYLDVREYLWTSQGQWGRSGTNGSTWYDASSVTVDDDGYKRSVVTREVHFYDHETGEEVDFSGVIAFSDFDWEEGYRISQGYHQAYLENPTVLVRGTEANTWLGQGDIANQLSFDGSTHELWVEVDGTKTKPLILEYIVPSSRGSGTVSPSISVNYNLIGENPEEASAPTFDVIAKYGTITPNKPQSTIENSEGKFVFSGWYYDEDMTMPVADSISVGEDTNLYGRYIKDGDAEKEDESGTIKVPDTGANDIFSGAGYTSDEESNLNIAGLITSSATCFIGLMLLIRASKYSRVIRFKKAKF